MKKFLIILGLLFGVMAAVYAASDEFPEQWVLSKYIKDGKVNTGNPQALLNVRSGPGANFDSVRTLKLGQPVISYATNGEWVRISPDAKVATPAPEAKVAEKAPAKEKKSSTETPMVQYAIILTGLVALVVLVFVQGKD